jgi:universal stress protein E
MAKTFKRILVAVRDLHHAPKNELRKAGALAKASGASIELYHVIDEPDPGRSFPETATAETIESLRTTIASKQERRLQQFARDESLTGLRVTCTADWDYPVHEAIIRRAMSTHADLVVAASRGHRFGARLLLINTDWELIRHCPVPLLLVKSRRPYQKPVVLAAVDPFHAHARPSDLDARLLDTATQVARLLRGAAHIFHAYMPLVTVEPMTGSVTPLVVLPPSAEEAHRELIARTIDRLAEKAGIPRARRHINMGDVSLGLTTISRRTHADLVVMGAVSRSALKRLFIGNAAERVLDKLSCDVLIVKPRDFKSGVAAGSSVSAPKPVRTPVLRARGHRQPGRSAVRPVLPPLL